MKFALARCLIVAACIVGAATGVAQPAGDYPNRAVRLIVPQAAGGGLDSSTRLIATRLADNLGQSVVIENRPSAGGIAGMEAVARAAPDGYTLLMASATVALNTALGVKLPYDPERDFAPLSLGVSIPMLFVVHPATPYRSLQDIVDDSKRQPGGVAVAIASIGTLPQMLPEETNRSGPVNQSIDAFGGNLSAGPPAPCRYRPTLIRRSFCACRGRAFIG